MAGLCLLLLLPLFLYAEPLKLQEQYYTESDLIEADIFLPEIEENFIIGEMKNRNRIQFAAHKIQQLFAEHGIEVIPTHPVITVSRQPDFDALPLKAALTERFTAQYPGLMIERITVRPRTFFDQNGATLLAVDLPAPNLTKNKGTFSAKYRLSDGKESKVFFGYRLLGSIEVLKAKRNIANGTILQMDNSGVERIPFEGLRTLPLSSAKLGKVRVRGYVKQGSIITAAMVRDIPDVTKGQRMALSLESGGIRISIYAIAKEDGRIGETIRFETDDGKRYKALIMEKNKAVIQ